MSAEYQQRGNELWGRFGNEPWRIIAELHTEYTTAQDYFMGEVAYQIAPASKMFWKHYWNRKVNPDYKITPSHHGTADTRITPNDFLN